MATAVANAHDSSGFLSSSLYPTLKSANCISNETLALSDYEDSAGAFRPAALVPFSKSGEDKKVLVLNQYESTFGRDSSCDHALESLEISRKHASIKFENGSWWIEDLGSTNGILIQGIRLKRYEKVSILDGYSVCFGPVEQGHFKYIFRENYPSTKMPSVSTVEYTLFDPSGYENSVPTQDLNITSMQLRESENHYRREISELKKRNAQLELQLREQKKHQRLISNDYRQTSRALIETEGRYKRKIDNLKTMMKRYRTLVNQLEPSHLPHPKSLPSSDDESSNEHHLCNSGLHNDSLSKLQREMTCSICSEYFVMPTSLSCSHVFCLHCIDQWRDEYRSKYNLASNGICPVCRKEVDAQTPVLAFENVIELVLESTLSPQEKEDRQMLVESRKQRRVPTSISNSQFSSNGLGSFLQQILNGLPRSRRSSIVIQSDDDDDHDDQEEEDMDDHDEDDDDDDVVEISYHGDSQDAHIEVDLDLSDADDEDESYDISITVSSGGSNANESFDIQLQEMLDEVESDDEILFIQ